MPDDTSLMSDIRPYRSGAVTVTTNEINNSGRFISPDISGRINIWDHISGNVSTIVAANSGAFAPAGMIRINVSGVARNIPFFNP